MPMTASQQTLESIAGVQVQGQGAWVGHSIAEFVAHLAYALQATRLTIQV